jgi:hypothetical protein
MNFRFTKLKTITSIITPLIISAYTGLSILFGKCYDCLPKENLRIFFNNLPQLLLFTVSAPVIIYLIWSLFQKKVTSK